ncbi:MAG: hypothetical protein J5J00_05295, partial [Deltaproteobacteria bacterium]|nr:hypothetical protein [Deltaproteobacteria bacterium]
MAEAAHHPILQPSTARMQLAAVVILRSLFLCVLVVLLDKIFEFGTSLQLLSLAVVAGTVCASFLAFTRLSTTGFILLLLAAYVSLQTLSVIVTSLPWSRPGAFFLPYSYSEHLWLAFIFFAFAAASGWCFWKWRHALTIE